MDEAGLLDPGDDLDLDAGLVAGPVAGTRRRSRPRAPRWWPRRRCRRRGPSAMLAEAGRGRRRRGRWPRRRAASCRPPPEPSRTISFSRAMTSNGGPSPDRGHDQVERVGADVDARRPCRNEFVADVDGGRAAPSSAAPPSSSCRSPAVALHAGGRRRPRRRRSGGPGWRVVRSIGPDTLTAATTRPGGVAHRRATPTPRRPRARPRSATQPGRRRRPSVAVGQQPPGRADVERAGWRRAGTIVRRPWGDSSAATQTRRSPSRT